jgi:Zn-dependent protease
MIVAAVGAALLVVLVVTHRITRFEIIYFCVLIPSIILHELSHGVVALAFGDTTAKAAGRLSLNPVRHVDPVGTLLVPAVLSLSGVGAYGWAKPVPVNPARLRSPRNHIVLVSLVGPLTNFALAAAAGAAFVAVVPADVRALSVGSGYYPPSLLGQVLFIAGIANIVLGLFNLLPCPPLDGAAVLERLLPEHLLPRYYSLQPLLMFLPFIVLLMFHGVWSQALGRVIGWWSGLLA